MADVLQAAEWRTPVAFHLNGYGDRILAAPALRALAQLFEGRLSIVCARGDGETFYSDLCLRQTIEVDAHREKNGWMFDVDAAGAAVGSSDLWLGLNSDGGPASRALRQRLNPRLSVGFDGDENIPLVRPSGEHAVDAAFALPRIFDSALLLEAFSACPPFPDLARREAAEILAHIPSGSRILAVHTETLDSKTWPQSEFVQILDRFLERHEEFIAIVVDRVCGPIDAGLRGTAVIPCSRLRLATAMALVAQSDLFLGVDSCMLHVADFARVPGVALFAATDPKRFGFRFTPGEELCPARPMTSNDIDDISRRLSEVAGPPPLHRALGA